jgi:hypothetical protein
MRGGGQAGGRKASGMMTRRGFGRAVLAATAFAVSGCSAIEPTEILRYRLTVEVETPEGIKRAYSVWEYKVTDVAIGFTQLETRYRGEAVAVDFGNGKTLFALLISGDGQSDYPAYVVQQELHKTDEYQTGTEPAFLSVFPQWRDEGKSWIVPKELPAHNQTTKPPSGYPMLVTFKDLRDPASVVKVDPDDLAATFGAGYRLKAITVQVTDEPVTTGIEKRLGWLEDSKVMNNPGWARLPIESRKAINGLFSNTIGRKK